jgi:hypothetical protein
MPGRARVPEERRFASPTARTDAISPVPVRPRATCSATRIAMQFALELRTATSRWGRARPGRAAEIRFAASPAKGTARSRAAAPRNAPSTARRAKRRARSRAAAAASPIAEMVARSVGPVARGRTPRPTPRRMSASPPTPAHPLTSKPSKRGFGSGHLRPGAGAPLDGAPAAGLTPSGCERGRFSSLPARRQDSQYACANTTR